MARPGNGGNPNRTSPPPIIRCRGIDGHEGSHGKLTSTLQTMMVPEIPAPSCLSPPQTASMRSQALDGYVVSKVGARRFIARRPISLLLTEAQKKAIDGHGRSRFLRGANCWPQW